MRTHPKLHITIPFLCPLFLAGIKALAQPGCTDPQAQNYNAAATFNDGSCIYATTDISIPPVNPLDLQLSESSGLAFFNGRLWSHNDSGSWPLFYALDTLSGQVVQTFYVRNEIQTDWEDICTGNGYLYIGDFGNNAGNRTDLRILRIDMDSIGNALQDTVSAENIHFIYEDQTDFSGTNTSHNFDCEAMFFRDDSLHLFSKNGSNGYTKHYVLPAIPGTHIARLCDSLYVQGQVTSADISGDSLIVLIGYQPPLYVPFAVLLWDYAGNALFSGNKRRLVLGSVLAVGQQEGVCFHGARDGFISAEAVGQLNLPARFFRFDFRRFFEQPLALEQAAVESELHVYPNPFSDQVQVQTAPGSCIRSMELTDMSGKIHRRILPQPDEIIQLNGLGGLSPGIYILRSESCSGLKHSIKIQKGHD